MEPQHTLEIPLQLATALAHGFSRSDLKAVYLRGQKVRGLYTSASHTRTIPVPRWAVDDPHWWTLFTELSTVTANRPHALVTGNSAAYLRGLPVTLRPQLDIAVPPNHGVIHLPGVRTHRVTGTGSQRKAGLRFHDLGGILSIIARQEPVETVVEVLDALMGPWRSRPQLTRAELDSLVARASRGRGWRTLKTASDLARENVASPQETQLRLALIQADLTEPTVAHPIWIERFGAFVHPDLAYPFARLAIEYEGRQHFELTDQVLKDTERYYELALLGWTVIRVTALHSVESVVVKVRQFLGV